MFSSNISGIKFLLLLRPEGIGHLRSSLCQNSHRLALKFLWKYLYVETPCCEETAKLAHMQET